MKSTILQNFPQKVFDKIQTLKNFSDEFDDNNS